MPCNCEGKLHSLAIGESRLRWCIRFYIYVNLSSSRAFLIFETCCLTMTYLGKHCIEEIVLQAKLYRSRKKWENRQFEYFCVPFLNTRQEDWDCLITAVLRKRSGKRMDRVVTIRCYDGASDLRANLSVLVDSGSLRSFLNFTFKMYLWVLGFSCPSILLTPLFFSNPQSYIYSTKVLKLVFPGSETMLNLPWSIWNFYSYPLLAVILHSTITIVSFSSIF